MYYDGPATVTNGKGTRAAVVAYIWTRGTSWDGVLTVTAGAIAPGPADLALPDGRTGTVDITSVTDRQRQGATEVGPSGRFAGVGPPP